MRWSFAVLVVFGACKFSPLVERDARTDPDALIDMSVDETPLSDAPSDGPFIATTIQQVRDVNTPSGTPVHLTDVIVTAVDMFGDRTGDVWVQEPGGGPNSGIQLFGTSSDIVTTLGFRDVVDVVGLKSQFALTDDTTGRTVTEIAGEQPGMLMVTKKNVQATVTLDFLDATTLATLPITQYNAELEKWEGAYVQLTNVRATSNVATLVNGVQRFGVPAFKVIDAMLMFPSGITTNTCIASIRGVVTYFFDYNVYPISSGIVTSGGVCP